MKRAAKVLLPLVFWMGVWQVAALYVSSGLLLPAPLAVAARLWELAVTADFWRAAGATLLRVFVGMAAGVALGAGIAVLTSVSQVADWLLSPAVRIIRATPVASFILLILLWVATGRVPGVIAALMVLPVVWGNVSKGIAETDAGLLEMASAYGFGRFKTVRLIYVPSVRPYFTSACQTALGLAWKAGVAAEVLCLPRLAIGTQVYYSKIYLETPTLFAWTIVVIALSFGVDGAVGLLLRVGGRTAGEPTPPFGHPSREGNLRWRKKFPSREGWRAAPGGEKQRTIENRPYTEAVVSHVSVSFGDKAVLRDVSFAVPAGGITVLTGASGEGKTTLLRVLAGLQMPDFGDVTGGEVAILFQENRLLPWRTVGEHIADVLPGEPTPPFGHPSREGNWARRAGVVVPYLSLVELDGTADLFPAELSGGMARRLALARTLALGRGCLLLDEPFAGVDTACRARIMQRLSATGLPILMTSHEPDIIEAADRVIALSEIQRQAPNGGKE